MYFTSATTMVFLAGDHVLDTNITVANVARLTMRGESSSDNVATVVRNGSVGFSFTNMVDFNIYSLAFTSYNRSWSYGSHPASNSALFLQSTKYTKLVNCFFHDNLGTALTVLNTNITLSGNIEFTHNQCGCAFIERCKLGCGITALYSTLTITGNSFFHDNSQTCSTCAGAIYASASALHFNGANKFIGNSAEWYGGAIYTEGNAVLTFTGMNNFTDNSARFRGGAVYTEGNAVLTFTGTNNFTGNSAWNGGAIHAQANTLLSFSGTNIFTHNSAYRGSGGGGAFYASGSAILTFSGSNNFSSSAGYNGGAIYISGRVVFTLNGINNFINNSAEDGGGIYADIRRSTIRGNAVVTFNGTNNFINNSANEGGAIYTKSNVLFRGISNFIHNSADYGHAIITWSSHNAVFTFTGTNNFFNNSAKIRHGGAILIIYSKFMFNGSNNFTGNSANGNGGAIFSSHRVLLSFTGTSSFCSNSAMQGGAVSANLNSILTFDGNVSFTNNGYNTLTRDSRGGAMYLGISSTLSTLPHTTVRWENNHANLGGAIYVMNANPLIYCTKMSSYIPKQECFFQLPRQNIDVKFIFKNNSADAAGSMLYGGAIDHCKLNGLNFSNSSEVFGLNFSNSGEVFDLLVKHKSDNGISSDPFYVCLCENDHLNCNKSNKTMSMYPGETVQVSMVSTGQRNGIVPAEVRSHMNKGKLLSSQYVQQTTKMCTTLNYTVFSLQNVTIELYADGPCSTFGDNVLLKLNINQTCPPAFSLENSSMSCVCDQALQKYTNNCNITNGRGQITRESDDTFGLGTMNKPMH